MSEKGQSYLLGADVFIQHTDGRVLLVHHAKTDHWVLPGGGADEGETPRSARYARLWRKPG
ncbi:hypothetical protein GCM10010218_13050 [Streptomyces mashuensis]|uniref:Nudix hydrolase domain-containing protein n=1 Tax=Streptomyces mashuensis TaxID=33904 RepID=A0A919B102_9ACTN|nr:hypothetical protein GCM10010218_13050 [Streptomyces mashuensis]